MTRRSPKAAFAARIRRSSSLFGGLAILLRKEALLGRARRQRVVHGGAGAVTGLLRIKDPRLVSQCGGAHTGGCGEGRVRARWPFAYANQLDSVVNR